MHGTNHLRLPSPKRKAYTPLRTALPPPILVSSCLKKIVFRSLETSPAATFLRADDASDGMESLRSAVKEAACNPELGELSAELEDKYSSAHPELCSLKDALHVPSIIHSTMMRIAVQPSGPAEKRLSEGLADLGARWEPATVKVGAMSLVHEKHPYMHLSRERGEARRYSLQSR
eukprot:g2881.t1